MKKQLTTIFFTIISLLATTNRLLVAQETKEKEVKQDSFTLQLKKNLKKPIPVILTITTLAVTNYFIWLYRWLIPLDIRDKSFLTAGVLWFTLLIWYLSAIQPIHQKKQNTPPSLSDQVKKKLEGIFLLLGAILYGIYTILSYKYPKAYLQPFDWYKVEKSFLLYKIQEGNKTSYLYSTSHVKSNQYKIPEAITQRVQDINRLVTDYDYEHDEDLKKYVATRYKKIIEEYNKEPKYPLIEPYIELLNNYQKNSKLQFLPFYRSIWMAIKYNGQAKYPLEELYKLCSKKEKANFTTFSRLVGKSSNLQKLGEKDAASEWLELKQYQHNQYYRMKISSYLTDVDDTIPVLRSQQYNWGSKPGRAAKRQNEEYFLKMLPMIKKNNNLFVLRGKHINHILYLLLSTKKYTITRILEDGSEETVSLENNNYNTPFL